MSESAPEATSADAARVSGAKSGKGSAKKKSFFARVALFVRQVVAELKKVTTPTRSELLQYTGVVLVFLVVVMAFITVVDMGVGKFMLWLFGA
ncbi:protein translocase subunit secE/sec61 gamma [Flavimobilis soli]|uniref:Protein translocase subunit SecE n=1 Tax=Flavimobilis soli TaxID=442709 RepID=A0A2A9EDW7_9MICO|nr:preprotein translocase subunit SecE [Flavimobilis soli]PFG36400.1 protein translocase subunit secE/sec61 gamma [Flavimobilis soli]